jgi:hypothetical protein
VQKQVLRFAQYGKLSDRDENRLRRWNDREFLNCGRNAFGYARISRIL